MILAEAGLCWLTPEDEQCRSWHLPGRQGAHDSVVGLDGNLHRAWPSLSSGSANKISHHIHPYPIFHCFHSACLVDFWLGKWGNKVGWCLLPLYLRHGTSMHCSFWSWCTAEGHSTEKNATKEIAKIDLSSSIFHGWHRIDLHVSWIPTLGGQKLSFDLFLFSFHGLFQYFHHVNSLEASSVNGGDKP